MKKHRESWCRRSERRSERSQRRRKRRANKADEKEHKGKQREPTSDSSTHSSLSKGEETECHDSASGYENNTRGSNESSTLPLQGHLQQTAPREISDFDLIQVLDERERYKNGLIVHPATGEIQTIWYDEELHI